MTWQSYYITIYGLAILVAPVIYPKMVLNFKLGSKERVPPGICLSGGLALLYPYLTPSIYRTILQLFLVGNFILGMFFELFVVEWNFPLPKKQKYAFNIFFAFTNLLLVIAVLTS